MDNQDELIRLTKENNMMLRYLVGFVNQYKANYNSENDTDFIRNIIANMISNNINNTNK